jgi:type VI secretion system secreted protein Hcp
MAAVDYFLKIDGIQGESKDKTHPNEIQCEHWSFGAANQGTFGAGGGGGAGKVAMQDFSFSMTTNKASSKLFLACANGEHLKNAILTCRKAGKEQQEYLKWTFTDLLISSFNTSGSGSAGLPMDNTTFNFTKLECEYKEQKIDGTLEGPIKTYYDLKKQEGG